MSQNQITEPQEPPDVDQLPPLSEKERALVEALADGCNNTEAYRRSYGAGNYSAPALRVAACRKVAEPHIQNHLRSLRSVGLAKAQLTLDDRIEDELAFAQRAEQAGNFGAAGQARDRVNKLLGLYIERHEHGIAPNTLEALQRIARLAGHSVAEKLARKHNVPWTPKVIEHA